MWVLRNHNHINPSLQAFNLIVFEMFAPCGTEILFDQLLLTSYIQEGFKKKKKNVAFSKMKRATEPLVSILHKNCQQWGATIRYYHGSLSTIRDYFLRDAEYCNQIYSNLLPFFSIAKCPQRKHMDKVCFYVISSFHIFRSISFIHSLFSIFLLGIVDILIEITTFKQ